MHAFGDLWDFRKKISFGVVILYLECLNFWDESCLLFLYSVLKTINSPAQNKKVIRNGTMFCGESFSLKIVWTHVEQEWSWKEVAVGCFIDFFAQLHVDGDKLRYETCLWSFCCMMGMCFCWWLSSYLGNNVRVNLWATLRLIMFVSCGDLKALLIV